MVIELPSPKSSRGAKAKTRILTTLVSPYTPILGSPISVTLYMFKQSSPI